MKERQTKTQQKQRQTAVATQKSVEAQLINDDEESGGCTIIKPQQQQSGKINDEESGDSCTIKPQQQQQSKKIKIIEPDYYFIDKGLGRTSSSCSSSLFRLNYGGGGDGVDDVDDYGDDISTILDGNNIPQVHCYKRFMMDIKPCQPWFHVEDPVTGLKIDVVLTFAPSSCNVMLWKFMTSTISFTLLFWSFCNVDTIKSWPYYFVHWGLLFTTIYLILSFFNSMLSSCTLQPPERVNTRMAWTWLFFALASTWSGLATLLFWFFDYFQEVNNDEEDLFSSLLIASTRMDAIYCIFIHGPLTLICWLDGLYVNRIPMRWPHLYGFVLPLLLLYVSWVLINTYSNWDLGTIQHDENDHLLYGTWMFVDDSSAYDYDDDVNNAGDLNNDNDEWVKSALISNAAVIGLGSALYFALWMASQYTISCSCSCEKRLCNAFRKG